MMKGSTESTQDLTQLYDDVKKYVLLQTEYAKVEVVEKMTILLSTLLIIVLIAMLAVAMLFYLCLGLVYAIEPMIGNLALSFVLVSLLYGILIGVVVAFRKSLVINPLVRFLSRLFLKDDKDL